MSAFIVSPGTIDRVVLAVLGAPFELGTAVMFATEPQIALDHPDSATKLGKILYRMNADAVNQRYGTTDKPPRYKFVFGEYSDAEVLQAADCYMYQCIEGDVPERPLFKAIQAIAHWYLAEGQPEENGTSCANATGYYAWNPTKRGKSQRAKP